MTTDIRYIGVNDHELDLFEGMYTVPRGMAYNSYVILDEQIAVLDSVEQRFGEAWLAHLAAALDGRTPDYLIVQHMEPDHSANILRFLETYPGATVVASAKAFAMMRNFFGREIAGKTVGEGATLSLGRHTLTFLTAPMVHWPEVILTYDACDRVLFSADAFGKFGALDVQEAWVDEAARYYFGIVGKYGAQVQALLKKASALAIDTICPLHGPVLTGDTLAEALRLYGIWSAYGVEREGVVIAYASIYGHTAQAALRLAELLRAQGTRDVQVFDLCRCDMAEAVSAAFRYGRLVLAAPTYNADVFPCMGEFIRKLVARGYRGRTVGLIENGSWAPMAAKVMRTMLEGCKELTIAEPAVRIDSALSEKSAEQLTALAAALA